MKVQSPRDLGALLRDRRQQLKLSQRDLAERAGVSQVWISQIEGGKRTAQIGLLLRLIQELGLQIDVGVSPTTKLTSGYGIDVDEIINDHTRK